MKLEKHISEKAHGKMGVVFKTGANVGAEHKNTGIKETV